MNMILIAGPNGSGKSTHGPHIIKPFISQFKSYEYLDLDRIASHLVFKGYENEDLIEKLEEYFVYRSKEAIKGRVPFVFESNLVTNPYNDILRFKQAGFRTTLLFFTLNSIEESKVFVNQRVQEGGHYVSEEDIEYNFKHGLINLQDIYRRSTAYFDTIIIYDMYNRIPVARVHIDKNTIVHATGIPKALDSQWTEKLSKDLNRFRQED